MGILNVTPDSFSDGGRYYLNPQAALDRARKMVMEGAAIIDVGAESTRPGAAPVSVEGELERILPVVELLVRNLDVVVSVDTSNPAVMREAAALGAGFINDVRALRRPGAMEAAVATGLPICLMHMQGEPGNMQQKPEYADVVNEVKRFLEERIAACVDAGVETGRLVLDPGFGFGKSLPHNVRLLAELPRLTELGLPLLVGVSRKSMLGALLGNAPVDQRLHAGVAAAAIAVVKGAKIIRTHDVQATCDALAVAAALVE
jgi:dihydropteroate synthase